MVLLIIAGLFALIAGRITIAPKLRLAGKKARTYGMLLLILSIPYSSAVYFVMTKFFPAISTASPFNNQLFLPSLDIIIRLLLNILAVVGLAVPFREKN